MSGERPAAAPVSLARSGPRLARAAALLDQAARLAPTRELDDDASLRREAVRIRPFLETLVGCRYGRLPALAYRRGLEARIAGPWSQYLTLGLPFTRLVRITPAAASRGAIATVLAHELAHRYAFDESVTTLRGLEASARLAADGDRLHGRAARLELARLLLGAAMVEALQREEAEPIQAFLAARAEDARLARAAAHWQRLRARRRVGADWASTVYAALPVAALEQALARGASQALPLPFPRFPLDSFQAAAAFAYTGSDALLGRRRVRVPVDATLALWRGAG